MKLQPTYPNPELKTILKQRGFKVSFNNVPKAEPSAFGRRHFFLILLSIGESKVHYKDHIFHLDGAYLFFANSRVPYATEIISENHNGYSCVFTENFIKPIERLESVQQSPLFKTSSIPAFKLNNAQQSQITAIFDAMIANDSTDYLYKDDLMRNYIQQIIHEALHLRPAEYFIQFNNAALRITTQFMEILERQFPIENLNNPLKLKSAQDFANHLSIHANYLNRAVKEITGKSTTAVISERIIAEAKALLQHSDWSVADIAYSLGFEYPNYFSSFFKKETSHTPKVYRNK